MVQPSAASWCSTARDCSQSSSRSRSGASSTGRSVVVRRTKVRAAARQCQQVQVVVAEHHHRGVAEALDGAQHVERARAAVDEVTDEPQAVACGTEVDDLEQAVEFGAAALHVADGLDRHRRQCSRPGTASVNGAIGASKCSPSSATMRYLPCIAPTGVSRIAPLE